MKIPIKGIKYEFHAEPWQHSGPGGWHFISVPKELAEEIRSAFKLEEEGWGRLKVMAQIGQSEWKTAIWFDTKMKTYLLPLKAEIRQREEVLVGKELKVIIWI